MQLIVTLVMDLWLQLTDGGSASVTVMLVLLNAMVVGCLLFTLMKTLSGMSDIYEAMVENGGGIMKSYGQKVKRAFQNAQKLQR